MEKAGMKKISRAAKKKKRIRLLVFILASLILVFAAALIFNLVFKVNNLTVINNTVYSDEELLSASGISEGTPMLFLQQSSVSEKISFDFPYVESVLIDRAWPFSATVTFEPAVPKYAMEISEGSFLTVSEGFKVLSADTSYEEGLVPVKGIVIDVYKVGEKLQGDDNIEVDLLNEIIDCLRNFSLYDRLTGVDFTKKHNYVIVLDNTITVELGTSDDLDKKFDKLKDILDRNSQYSKMNISVRDYTAGRCTILDE